MPKIFVSLTPKGVDVFAPKDEYNLSYSFTESDIRFHELSAAPELRQALTALFKEFKSSQAVLFFSKEFVFGKDVKNVSPEVLKGEIESFIQKVPLEPGQVMVKTLSLDFGKNVFVMCVNRKNIDFLKSVLEENDINLEFAVPLFVFDTAFFSRPTYESLKEIIDKKTALVKKSDFLRIDDADYDLPVGVSENKTPRALNKKILLFVTGGLLLVGIVVGAGYFLLMKKDNPVAAPQPQAPQVQETTISVPLNTTPETSEAVEINYKQADEIKVVIRNGSGIPGQAKKVATVLEDGGFGTIETGNFQGDTLETAMAEFVEEVPEEIKESVTAKLETLFVELNVETVPSEGKEYDILIITGKNEVVAAGEGADEVESSQ